MKKEIKTPDEIIKTSRNDINLMSRLMLIQFSKLYNLGVLSEREERVKFAIQYMLAQK